jgi:hypothetical protein
MTLPAPSSWSPPQLLAGDDDLAIQRRRWRALDPEARWQSVMAWISTEPDWVAGVGDEAMEAWGRAFRAVGPVGAHAMARESEGECPEFPEPLTDSVARRRWQQVAERWGFVRIEAYPGAAQSWQECLPAMEAAWAKMAEVLGVPERGIGAGRLSLMLDEGSDHSAFDRLTQTVRLGHPDAHASGFLHEWAHAVDSWLGAATPSTGAPSRFPSPLSKTHPHQAFPAEPSLPVWERYQGVWAAWGAAWRSWSTTLPGEQGAAARAWWVQAERMHRRGALSEQALKPLHLFLDSLPRDPQVDLFKRWMVDPPSLPQDSWQWAAQQLDSASATPYLSLPQELWARAVQGVVGRLIGAAWTHERVDHAALFPVLAMGKHWQDHWQTQWPAWRQTWLADDLQPSHAGAQP